MTVEIVQLEASHAADGLSRQEQWLAQLERLARARAATLGGRQAIGAQDQGRPVAEPPVATIPLVPRSLAHLPAKRWCWAARRRLAQDHPFGRIGRIEANLEQLVDELAAEVDRLVARTGELIGTRRDH